MRLKGGGSKASALALKNTKHAPLRWTSGGSVLRNRVAAMEILKFQISIRAGETGRPLMAQNLVRRALQALSRPPLDDRPNPDSTTELKAMRGEIVRPPRCAPGALVAATASPSLPQ